MPNNTQEQEGGIGPLPEELGPVLEKLQKDIEENPGPPVPSLIVEKDQMRQATEIVQRPVGRPTKMTPETVSKLEECFMLGCTDEEACLVADISKQTLYDYQKEHPEYVDRKEALKQWPNYQARTSVIEGIKKDPELALKYLSKKKKDEFSDRVESTGADGVPIVIQIAKEVSEKHNL